MGAPARMRQYIEAGLEPPLPDLPDGGDHMLSVMFALNPLRPMAMGGVRAADWPEIYPFMQATGAVSDPWEAEFLHQLCAAYAAGFNAGQTASARSPMELFERELTRSAARS